MNQTPKTVLKTNWKKIFFSILFFAILPFGKLWAQGCECMGCTGTTPPTTIESYVLNISGATNTNLNNPGQGLCRIFIDISTLNIWGLELTLTSPAGQSITLMGPFDPQTNPVFIANWDISFLPCSETVSPDIPLGGAPFLDQWTNLQSWGNDFYIGSYYPYIGCLEDFNFGSVNGDWTLTVDNGSLAHDVTLNEFSLLFCDDAGMGCGDCDANAGNLSGVNDIDLCVGENHGGSIAPFYNFGEEPNNQYSYTYIVSQGAVVQNYNGSPDFSTFSPGTYEVCGLSYLTDDLAMIPTPNGSLSLVDLENAITAATFCGDITDDCFAVNIYGIPDTIFLNDVFCNGGSYDFYGNNLTTSDTYFHQLPATVGCDTTVQLILTELAPIQNLLTTSICLGDTFFVADTFYIAAGSYSDTLISVNNCDSIVMSNLTILNPQANIAPPATLNCTNPQTMLNGTTSTSGTGVSYLWTTTDGNIVGDDFNNSAMIDEDGKYFLTVTITQNGVMCTDIDSVIVNSNIVYPTAEAGLDSILNCNMTSIELDGTGSSTGGFSYEWTTPDGNIVQDTFTLNPTIDSAGLYYLTVTDNNNNCEAIDSVMITADMVFPISEAGDDALLTCDISTVTLDGDGSSVGNRFIYQWFAGDGSILLGENSMDLTVNYAGKFELIVTDTFNYCSTLDSVEVTIDTIAPIANVGADFTLNCFLPDSQINASLSSQGIGFSHQWNVISGNPIVSGATTLSPLVDGEGVYELVVENDNTGCAATAQVTVNQDFIDPLVDIVMPIDTITCAQPIIEINANSSSNGINFSPTWTIIGSGNIFAGASSLQPQIDQEGTYQLEILNTQNGCETTATFDVFSNNTFPDANAGDDLEINCNQYTLLLNGMGSLGDSIEYLWTPLDGGNITMGQNTLSPTMDAGGNYELLVTNTSSNCIQRDTMMITVDTIPPIANAGVDTFLNCLQTSINLDGTNSSMGDFSYFWSTTNGVTPADPSSINPLIVGGGDYELLVTNNQNGCSSFDAVLVDEFLNMPMANAGSDTSLTCEHPTIFLNGNNSSTGTTIIFEWLVSNGGNIISNENTLEPEIDAAGTYQLVLTDTLSGCTNGSGINVTSNDNLPTAEAGQPDTLNCNQSVIFLSGMDLSMQSGLTYEWTTVEGNILSGSTTLTPSVDSAGWYFLEIENPQSGCFALDSVFIELDTLAPVAVAGMDTLINCLQDTIDLDGTGSSVGDYTYQWSTSNGMTPINSMTLQPTIFAGGDYELQVMNSQNGCVAIDSVSVAENFDTPTANAGQDTMLTCSNPIIFLDGSSSSPSIGISYDWTATNGGNIISGGTTPMPEINSAGTYQLVVTNEVSGCTTEDEVIVTLENNLPTAEAGQPDTLNCNQSVIILSGMDLSMQSGLTYEWTTVEGNILSGGNTLSPSVDSAGWYFLEIENPQSGCFALDSVFIEFDTLAPLAVAGMDTIINCLQDTIDLDGTGSSVGDYTYQWSTSNGMTPINSMTLQPTIFAGGDYELQVMNPQNGCVAIDSVSVAENFDTPSANGGPDTMLTCSNPIIFLDGSSSSPSIGISYDWTATNGGNIISGGTTPMPEINSAGTYQLVVTNEVSGCSTEDEVIVTVENNLPTAEAGQPDTLNCNQSVIILSGMDLSMQSGLTYEWTTVEGNILSGENTLSPSVDSAGWYFLEIENPQSGCFALDSVFIEMDTLAPLAAAGMDTIINCLQDSIDLDGTGSSVGDYTYQWSTSNGMPPINSTTLQPTIFAGGDYELQVMNSQNGCIAIDSVSVAENFDTPSANAGPDTMLTCSNPIIFLDGSNSSSSIGISYDWTATNGGNIISGETTPVPEINSAGTYQLVVTNEVSGCSTEDEVIVTVENNLPTAEAGQPDTLNCNQSVIILSGMDLSMQSGLTYEWTTVEGNILSGSTTLSPSVDSAGWYFLEIENPQSGCFALDSVFIALDTLAPIAMAGVDTFINCTSDEIILNGSNSSIGNEFTYQWTTLNPTDIINPNSLTPQVDTIGVFQLEVTNTQNNCVAIDEVQVTWDTISPVADAGIDMILDCDTTVATLGGNSSMGINYDYNWTPSAGGNIITDFTLDTVMVDGEGTYSLTVTNSENGCLATDEVIVTQDADLPMANVIPFDTIPCTANQITLNGNGSSTGNEFIYEWMTVDGNIVADTNLLFPVVDSAGIYVLTVTDTTNNCEVTASVNVVLEDCVFVADAGSAGVINCNDSTLVLDGTGSSMGMEYIYEWTTNDGNIVADTNSLTPLVNAGGTYVLTVQNTITGLSAIDSVVVMEVTTPPNVVLSVNELLDCEGNSVLVSGVGSSAGLEFLYSWDTDDGNILSIIGGATISVDEPGFYFLEIQNTQNGCVTLDSIEVMQDNDVPVANAGIDLEINCYNSQFALDGTASSMGDNYIYHWTTVDGNIISGDSTLTPLVDSIGTYILEVTNTTNGCSSQNMMEVSESFTTPISDAGLSDTLTCMDSILVLSGNTSTQGNNYTYLWTTDNGNILLGENTLMPQIDSSGLYELIVTDTINGCADTSSVLIEEDFILPLANAGQDTLINCGEGSIILDGTNSSIGGIYEYSWETIGGLIQNNNNTLTPEVSQAGTYTLTVLNTQSGCSRTDEMIVAAINCTPVISIALPDTLTCEQISINIDGSNSSNWASIVYQWTTDNGNIIGATNAPMINVNLPGEYQLVLTDTLTNETAFGEVTVEINDVLPIANAGIPDTLNCNVTELFLDGLGSAMGDSITYNWTTVDGNIISGESTLQPLIDESAWYELEVSDLENGCIATDSVFIAIDTIAPIVEAGIPVDLTCVDTLLQLDASGSSVGNNFTYQWTTDVGNIESGGETLFPEINASGNYQLVITNNQNFCISIDSVLVGIDTLAPTVLIEMPLVLNCTLRAIDLDASNSSTGMNFSYTWETADGNILSTANPLMPQIEGPGDYELTIVSFGNGCSATSSTTVIEDIIAPIADAGNPVELTCTDTILTLDGSGSSDGSEYLYQWTTTDGNIVSGADSRFPEVSLPVEYELVVTNTNNNCTDTSQVIVTQDVLIPAVSIDTPDTLNCEIESIALNAENTSNELIFSYLWSTNDGNVTFGENTLTPQVDDGGTYDLLILNNENGCTASTSVVVVQDTIVPISEAGLGVTLNCVDTTIILDGSASSFGNEYSYQWSTTNGNIILNENSTMPVVDEVGQYTLEVLNNNNQCTAIDSVPVFEDLTAPQIEINAIGGLVLNCNVSSIVLDGSSSSPTGNLNFEWTTQNGNILLGDDLPNPEVDLAGEYILTLTNESNGCFALDTVEIQEDFVDPDISIQFPDTLNCIDTILVLDALSSSVGSEFDYSWTTLGGNFLFGENTLEPQIDAPGIYTLTIVNTENGCAVNESVTVFENVVYPFADAGGPYQFDCIQTELTLEGDASQGNLFEYEWSTIGGNFVNGINTLQPTVDEFGTYILSVTNIQNGCEAISETLVTEDLDVPEDIVFRLIEPLCQGDFNGSIEIENVVGGEPPYSYSFDNQPFTDFTVFSNLAGGNYSFTVLDASGCRLEMTVELPDPTEVTVDLGEDIFLELGDSTSLEAITNIPDSELDSVVWMSSGELDCTECLEQAVKPFRTTTYTVWLMNENGCLTEDEVVVYVNNKRRVFIPNAFSPNGDGNNDVMMIYGGLGVEEVERFQIFSRWGELVFSKNNFQPNDPTMGWNGYLDGKKMNPGVFVFYAKIKYSNGESEVIKGDLFLK